MRRSAPVILALAALVTATAAHADLVVRSVTGAPGIATGTRVPDGHTFTLPDGADVTLRREPAGSEHRMRGTFTGTLEAYERSCRASVRPAYCPPAAGADKGGGTRGGATRGLSPSQ